ncbi:MAG: alpha/beta hydrolase [Candidatus Rokuibacteriota bacterium]
MRLALWAALVGGAFVAFSLFSFWLAVRPPRIHVALEPRELRLAPEVVTITTRDGLRLAGWLLPRPGAAAVVLLHGYPADKADMLTLAAALAPEFTVLLYDQRYFGASEGHATTIGHRERDDLSRALDLLAARGVRRVGVFGFSLGGAVALMTAAEDPRVAAVVAYAPFADLATLGHDLYWWMGPARRPFVTTVRAWSRLFLGVDIARPSPAQAAPRLAIPVWLVHSRDDDQIPFSHAERLGAALARNPRAVVEAVDGPHGALPDAFPARLADFFRRALAERS